MHPESQTTPIESGERNDDPRAPGTLLAAIVGAVVIFVIVVLLEAFFYRSEEDQRALKVYGQVPEELAGLRAQQTEVLGSYRWVDQGKGVAGIPIDRAMELVVRDQGLGSANTATHDPAAGRGPTR